MSWMADFHRCLDCKFAEWKRTKTGALHPSVDGRCKWEYNVPVISAACRWNTWMAVPPWPSRISINRREPIARCPVFQRSA